MTQGLQLRYWSSPADPSTRAVEVCQGSVEGKSFWVALGRLAREIEGTAFLIVRVDEVDCAQIHQAIDAFQRTASGTRLCLAGTHSTLTRLGSDPFDSDRVGWMLDDIDVTTPWSEIVSNRIEAIRFCSDFVGRAGRNLRLRLVLEAMLLLARDLGLCSLGSDDVPGGERSLTICRSLVRDPCPLLPEREPYMDPAAARPSRGVDEPPQGIWHRHRRTLPIVHPHRFRSTARVQHARLVTPLQGDVGFEAAPTRLSHVVLRQHIARVLQLLQEVAERIHDHWPLSRGVWRARHPMQPLDADDLQVAKIDGVVDMAHRIHVAPADRDHHLQRQLLRLGKFESHVAHQSRRNVELAVQPVDQRPQPLHLAFHNRDPRPQRRDLAHRNDRLAVACRCER